MTKKIMFMVAAALCLTLTGCKESGDTDEPSDGSGGGGGGGTPTLEACTNTGAPSGHFVDEKGVYKEVAIGTVVNSITVKLAGSTARTQSFVAEIRACDFAGSILGTSTVSNVAITSTSGAYTSVTFPFTQFTTGANCGGSGSSRVAFKINSTSGSSTNLHQIYYAVVSHGALACTLRLSDDLTSSPPSSSVGNFDVFGSLQ